jgi:anti-sigma factor RsiW
MDSTLMTCRELVELVTAYQEDALPPEERARFEAHLIVCPPCGDYVAQMAQTARVAGALCDDDEVATESTQQLLAVFRDWKRQQA